MSDPAPFAGATPDVPGPGSGFDYSTFGAGAREKAAIDDFRHEQQMEVVLGIGLIIGAIVLINVAVRVALRWRRMAESTAQAVIRTTDRLEERCTRAKSWWGEQKRQARAGKDQGKPKE